MGAAHGCVPLRLLPGGSCTDLLRGKGQHAANLSSRLRARGHDERQGRCAGRCFGDPGYLCLPTCGGILRRDLFSRTALRGTCIRQWRNLTADFQLIQLAPSLPHRGRQRAGARGSGKRFASHRHQGCQEDTLDLALAVGGRARASACWRYDLCLPHCSSFGPHAADSGARPGSRRRAAGGARGRLRMLSGLRAAHDELSQRQFIDGRG
mmetsp:Transcript_59080/g.106163  ORF Transcript_59080/g.106163 Transcript_59080/m.106163 type:complete len:209 (+) Transcript_59080:65-691(+)